MSKLTFTIHTKKILDHLKEEHRLEIGTPPNKENFSRLFKEHVVWAIRTS